MALLFRNLLVMLSSLSILLKTHLMMLQIPTPPAEVDHRARFNGWNLDERWKSKVPTWKGDHYSVEDLSAHSMKGQRPIVVFHGGIGNTLAVQFVELNSVVVGNRYLNRMVNFS